MLVFERLFFSNRGLIESSLGKWLVISNAEITKGAGKHVFQLAFEVSEPLVVERENVTCKVLFMSE